MINLSYIYVGEKDKWPQLTKLRGKKLKSGYYFGPFASVGSAELDNQDFAENFFF